MRAFGFLGGVPEVLMPDNLVSGITKPCRYEPDINSTYADMAAHYALAVVSARVRKSKDKERASYCLLCGRFSLFMVTFARLLSAKMERLNRGSILDLKTIFMSRKYIRRILISLGKNGEAFLIDDSIFKTAEIGRITGEGISPREPLFY